MSDTTDVLRIIRAELKNLVAALDVPSIDVTVTVRQPVDHGRNEAVRDRVMTDLPVWAVRRIRVTNPEASRRPEPLKYDGYDRYDLEAIDRMRNESGID